MIKNPRGQKKSLESTQNVLKRREMQKNPKKLNLEKFHDFSIFYEKWLFSENFSGQGGSKNFSLESTQNGLKRREMQKNRKIFEV